MFQCHNPVLRMREPLFACVRASFSTLWLPGTRRVEDTLHSRERAQLSEFACIAAGILRRPSARPLRPARPWPLPSEARVPGAFTSGPPSDPTAVPALSNRYTPSPRSITTGWPHTPGADISYPAPGWNGRGRLAVNHRGLPKPQEPRRRVKRRKVQNHNGCGRMVKYFLNLIAEYDFVQHFPATYAEDAPHRSILLWQASCLHER